MQTEADPPERSHMLPDAAGSASMARVQCGHVTIGYKDWDRRLRAGVSDVRAAMLAPASPHALSLVGPQRELASLGDIRVAAVSAADARRFAAIRTAALAGAHVEVIFGGDIEPALVRTRAAENRLFVVWVSPTAWGVFDPGGRQVMPADWRKQMRYNRELRPMPRRVAIDPALACDKTVARQTDTLAGRDVSLYEF